MLPKYANLENESNNFIFASKQLQNFRNIDTSGKDTILKSESSTTSSGIAPKNELEEFNSNLTEITTYIAQLKTYIKDSLNKGFVSARERQQFAERPPRDDLNADAEQEYDIQNKKAFEKIVDKEANNIGTLPPLKQISLFQGSSNIEMSGSGLLGSGLTERESFKQQFDKIEDTTIALEQLFDAFSELLLQLETEENPAKKKKLGETFVELITETQKKIPDFPITDDFDVINKYFTDTITLNLEEMHRLKEEIKQDYLGEKETLKPSTESIDQLVLDIATLQAMLDSPQPHLTEQEEDEFAIIKARYVFHGNVKNVRTVLVSLQGRLKPLSAEQAQKDIGFGETFASELTSTEDDIRLLEKYKIEKLVRIQKKYDYIVKQIQETNKRLAEIKKREERLEVEKAAALALDDRQKAERLARDADRAENKRLAEEAELGRLFAEQLAQEKQADEIKQQHLKDTADINKLKEVKGALTTSSPNVNPIISTLTKLISLITKQNVLFNGKIKKNINSLDRLDVEDLINKLNKVIINLQSIPNQSYISVSIENGYEMLKQLYDSLNKLSADVGNGVYSYTSKLRGGSRHYNDHYQYYSRMTVNDNPHIYKYMM